MHLMLVLVLCRAEKLEQNDELHAVYQVNILCVVIYMSTVHAKKERHLHPIGPCLYILGALFAGV